MTGRAARQKRIVDILIRRQEPVRGDELASLLGVTRQVVVHDIALARAQGLDVVATPRGYYLSSSAGQDRPKTVLAVRHDRAQTRDELYALVDHGLVVENVVVEHPIYGVLEGGLHLRSRSDVDQFVEAVESTGAALLSALTKGRHWHTVRYDREADVAHAVSALKRIGIEVEE